jgi:3-hydroxyacyl-[acyl-carrier-protein] dehydratase
VSAIKKEIGRLMKDFSQAEESGMSARFIFPEDFVGFQGHFPSGKVLPGVCQIQCVMLMIEHSMKKPVALREIIQAKYLSPILPMEDILCVCDVAAAGGDIIIRASFSRDRKKISELKLKVCV